MGRKDSQEQQREQFNVVVVGHVDHGKSTVIGRLLADTGSLPEGKLEQVRAMCARNAKPFEYAFLLDALQNEQNQGITIDTARCFFKSAKRDYIIIDAPGHIEFLKNMVTGAARAEAAILVIDAKEGVQENSRRHGYMLSMLGVRQVVVLINKMDLIGYDQKRFESIRDEYRAFLQQINIEPRTFLPVSAFYGQNLCQPSAEMPWFDEGHLLSVMDNFEKEQSSAARPLRFPVQDIYKFTEKGDDRRICAGRVESGRIREGDDVLFLPSGKRAVVAGIEEFNAPKLREVTAGRSIGFTLEPEVYIKQGELMVHAAEDSLKPQVNKALRVNLFWMGRRPMVPGKKYKLKIATAEHSVRLKTVYNVLDASELSSVQSKQQIDLHDVADCVLESLSPVAFDPVQEVPQTGRFVIVDEYDIAGGGIILDFAEEDESLLQRHIREREAFWRRSSLTSGLRSARYNQRAILVIISCEDRALGNTYAAALEEKLFGQGYYVYYLAPRNMRISQQVQLSQAEQVGEDTKPDKTKQEQQLQHGPLAGQAERTESLQRLGETAHMFCDSGAILVTTLSRLDRDELQLLNTLNSPYEQLVIQVGQGYLPDDAVHLSLAPTLAVADGVEELARVLAKRNILLDYYL
ncbi:GTP-binding protein [Candidatus Haliotispira prima]|uniref:sulfate adenylyltransferase n=1 Tax=Candidatus Haliotispira prima TaxID=3034016 RepID=A0ABY8MDL1_9SPIO|nr:GTP-binding protein [Candidatus Haliotispira prima]